ncbi:hypothetical protein GCM10027347_37620 [Larkinella harenae]
MTDYFVVSAAALSAGAAVALSAAIVLLSVEITDVLSVDVVSSVFGLLWQAANVIMLPTNKRANTFFIRSGAFKV